eukprot:928757-Lingulodinium_polyedra.AAC.1
MARAGVRENGARGRPSRRARALLRVRAPQRARARVRRDQQRLAKEGRHSKQFHFFLVLAVSMSFGLEPQRSPAAQL